MVFSLFKLARNVKKYRFKFSSRKKIIIWNSRLANALFWCPETLANCFPTNYSKKIELYNFNGISSYILALVIASTSCGDDKDPAIPRRNRKISSKKLPRCKINCLRTSRRQISQNIRRYVHMTKYNKNIKPTKCVYRHLRVMSIVISEKLES